MWVSPWKGFEFGLTVGDRVVVRRRGKPACTWRFCLVSSQGRASLTWLFKSATGFEKSEFWWSPKEGKVVGGPGGLPPGKFFWVLSWQNTNLEVVCIICQCKFSQEQPLGCIVRQIYETSFYDVNPWVSIRSNLAEHTSNCQARVPLSATFQRKEVLAVSQRMQCTKQYAFLRSYLSSAVWPFADIASAC